MTAIDMGKFVMFEDDGTFIIHNGTTGKYQLADVDKVSVLNEDAKFKGKSDPFSHQVLTGISSYGVILEPQLYVGLKIVLKNGDALAIYTSEEATLYNTDLYKKDRATAEAIKEKLGK